MVITEIPYTVQKGKLVEKLAELIELKKAPLLGDVRDESAEDIRLIVEPKTRNVEPVVLMESLFRLSELEVRFGLNMNVLSKGQVPNVLSLREVLKEWLDHRKDVLVRRNQFRLKKIEHRLEVLDGYLIAYLNIDEVIRIIRFEDEPKQTLMSPLQAERSADRRDPESALEVVVTPRRAADQGRAHRTDQGAPRDQGASEVRRFAVGAHRRRSEGDARTLFQEDCSSAAAAPHSPKRQPSKSRWSRQ